MRRSTAGRTAVAWLTGVTAVAVVGPSLLLGGAVADPQLRAAWWSIGGDGSDAEGVQVSQGFDGPTSVAAIAVEPGGLVDGALVLPVTPATLRGYPHLMACTTTDLSWLPGPAQPWEQRPSYDCSAAVPSHVSPDGTTLTFPLPAGAPQVELVLVPAPDTGEFTVRLGTPQGVVAMQPEQTAPVDATPTEAPAEAPVDGAPAEAPTEAPGDGAPAEAPADATPVDAAPITSADPAPVVPTQAADPAAPPAMADPVQPAIADPGSAAVPATPEPSRAPVFVDHVGTGYASEPLLSRHVMLPVPEPTATVPDPLVAAPPAEPNGSEVVAPPMLKRAFHQVPATDEVPHSVPFDVVDDPVANLVFPPLVAVVTVALAAALRWLRRPREVAAQVSRLRLELPSADEYDRVA